MPRAALNAITPHTLAQWGQRFGIRYRIDDAPGAAAPGAAAPVARGEVHDVRLFDSLHLTLSDLEVERGYTSSSIQGVPWFVSVVLEGEVSLTLGQQTLALGAGDGFCAHFDAARPLIVHQPRQRRLKTVNLAVLATAPFALPTPTSTSALHGWALPPPLYQTLTQAAGEPASVWRQRLVWQGLALQLLGNALPESDETAAPQLSRRDRACLSALHERIRRDPGAEYCLSALARDAAMSTSSLRQKFRQLYGDTLFTHVRRCRLDQARRYLEQGVSIQQTAHACGFKHATNFATAFKRAFGVTPHDVRSPR
ncbi:helix-turn-helix domain-containing protein [Halomonas sp. PAMB 3232]|uniref:helix-turn-helix domain-containing protein n=1 Tax=Halomonas sp. PAMB 3232 TaxID=3075221 RepID=UPI00289DB984|nr:helix-turn-helix domain-containing protein [Halomonas sp. PAMB 3232]WNL39152.1 helix-turn-helix domain-containing protein [Halomonas sp. PAMB 3232]